MVVVTPSTVEPMKPCATGTHLDSITGNRTSRARCSVAAISGTARVNCLSVTMNCRESTSSAGMPRAANAAVTITDDKRSPNETMASWLRGVNSPSVATERASPVRSLNW